MLKAPACGAGDRACDGRAMDAAFNYEYAIRTRDVLAKQRGPAAAKGAPKMRGQGRREPICRRARRCTASRARRRPAVDMNQFKIVIPKRGEERKDAPDAGKGGQKIRKG